MHSSRTNSNSTHYQLKIDDYKYKLLYVRLVTTKQKANIYRKYSKDKDKNI